jgi:hypothetical protein
MKLEAVKKTGLGCRTKELWKDPKYREHMRKAHLGQKAWNKGKKTGLIPKSAFKKGHKLSERTKQIIGESSRGRNNWNWKGDKVGYNALHTWVSREYGKPYKCEMEGCIYPRKDLHGKIMKAPKRYEWANITGKYLRDRDDWMMMCPSCHLKYDRGNKKDEEPKRGSHY